MDEPAQTTDQTATNQNVIDPTNQIEMYPSIDNGPDIDSTPTVLEEANVDIPLSNDNISVDNDAEPAQTPVDNQGGLFILDPVLSDQKNTSQRNNTNQGYIVEVPITMNKQNLQSKMKKTNIKKPDDMLQTIKQYHNVRLEDAKRTLK